MPFVGRFAIAMLVLLTAFACSNEPTVDPALAIAQQKVLNELTDPESARFRNLVRYDDFVCGEVNSKNQFGGYAGFAPFSFNTATGEAHVDVGDPDDLGTDGTAETNCKLAKVKIELRGAIADLRKMQDDYAQKCQEGDKTSCDKRDQLQTDLRQLDSSQATH